MGPYLAGASLPGPRNTGYRACYLPSTCGHTCCRVCLDWSTMGYADMWCSAGQTPAFSSRVGLWGRVCSLGDCISCDQDTLVITSVGVSCLSKGLLSSRLARGLRRADNKLLPWQLHVQGPLMFVKALGLTGQNQEVTDLTHLPPCGARCWSWPQSLLHS